MRGGTSSFLLLQVGGGGPHILVIVMEILEESVHMSEIFLFNIFAGVHMSEIFFQLTI